MKILLRDGLLWKPGTSLYRFRKSRIRYIELTDDLLSVTVSYAQFASNNISYYIERPMHYKPVLTPKPDSFQFRHGPYFTTRRTMSMIVTRILKNVLKIRYLILGGAVGSGISLHKTYQEWINSFPDLSWLDEYFPKMIDSEAIKNNVLSVIQKLNDIEIDPQLRDSLKSKGMSMKDWFNTKLDEAYMAADEQEKTNVANTAKNMTTLNALSLGKTEEKKQKDDGGPTITDEDLWEIQLKYQKELERLERENKDLRKQLLLRGQSSQQSKKKVRTSLIDMYSDVLDELTEYDIKYKTQDHLPRVVVIGDQSSGKTSVLEMIAEARIFPRGAGEMMTRSPVKVTLSEGPYHIAQFKGSTREFDLTKESDLDELRKEVELRMRNMVGNDKTVSNDVISMTVKGPGLQRMVLVDLPGIISTNTLGMAEDTKESIYNIAKYYMSNPNAIILCIQDGSVDAERSNVTDLVAQMDPYGRRTIFVLTKVDLAEENLTNPDRVKKILAGELFPMKALGYFAVVTGKGTKNESIKQIKQYEEKFFQTSKLFNSRIMKSTQLTTKNLSLAVSDCFWKMVQETVVQQANAFKVQRFNLETEWKNKYPRLRVMDRNELFDKARSEILDEVINLSEVPIEHWEDVLMPTLWNRISDYIFENIYFSTVDTAHGDEFNTEVDIKLNKWVEEQLPKTSIEAGWEVLQQEFKRLIYSEQLLKNHDDIFDALKNSVVDETLQRHHWEEKAIEVLTVMQRSAITDLTVTEKHQWDIAVRFLESCLKDRLEAVQQELSAMFGPSLIEQWSQWKYVTESARMRNEVKKELNKILSNNLEHPVNLSDDELTTVRNTLERSNVACENEFIRETWAPLYKAHVLQRTLQKIPYYMKRFFLYRMNMDMQEYNDVILFWRIQQMLKVTVNSLRQQIVNREVHRLDEEIKEVLDDFNRDQHKKETLLTGRRVTIAEELKRIKQIQDKLEDFIKSLNKEKQESRRRI